MKHILLRIFLLPFFCASLVLAQENDQLAELLEALDEGGGGIGGGGDAMKPEDLGYRSFVENELQNIFSQIDALSEQEKDDITFYEVNEKRIELATQLCSKDERACFLVDEYRSYKSKEDLPQSVEELKLFGQEIFSGYSNDFNFYDSLPLRNDYIVKIGDIFKISAFGGFDFEQEILVSMNGSVVIKDLGEIQVAGLTYEEASSKISTNIEDAFAGSKAIITLSQIRSKQIFVLGNVKTPGTYALNAFGTALNGLISSGGLGENSSLRAIKIIRGNDVIQTIDLYDLLINGNVKSSDFILNA